MRKIPSITEGKFSDKRVLLRLDLNVPIGKGGEVKDTSRVDASLPTIKYLLDQGAKVIILSHLGRPDGKRNPEYSLYPLKGALEERLGRKVGFIEDFLSEEALDQSSKLKKGEVLLLENLRFDPDEEKPKSDQGFAKKLARLGDCYVDDAFGCAHRAHSSIVDLPRLFKGNAYAGFLLLNEVKFLGEALQDPKHSFLALIGGAKVSTKLGVLKSLLGKVDTLAIGGAMAFTFLKAKGFQLGNSPVETSLIEEAKDLLKKFQEANVKVLLPSDLIITDSLEPAKQGRMIEVKEGIPDGFFGVDIGENTIKTFQEAMSGAKTIFWNGPMGIFEVPFFANGTKKIAEAFLESGAITVAGGGETVSAIKECKLAKKATHLSTGGGASLEFLEFGTLPGLEALRTKKR